LEVADLHIQNGMAALDAMVYCGFFGFGVHHCPIMVILLVTDPGKLKNHRFQKLSQFLNVFVGLLLGFFMSASVTKWWSCAEGFLALFDCIRCLQLQLLALGVPESDVNMVSRLGVLSCWILQMELHAEAVPVSERAIRRAEVLTNLMTTQSGLNHNPKYILLEKEKTAIQNLNDKPAQLWVWVFSYISKLAEDGVVPAMQTPTYNRLMSLAQQAFDAMREVRTSITLQAPYIYVQMLATLVHTNNLINAISFGLTLGVTVGTNLAYFHIRWNNDVKATGGQASRDIQDCIISFFFSCFGPFIYQALLEVSIAIAQPFSSEDAEIPTTRLIRQLETDLDQSEEMAVKISWKAPRFKK